MAEPLVPGVWITHSSDWLPADQVLSRLDDYDYEPDFRHNDAGLDRPKRTFPFPAWHQQAACVGQEEEVFFGATDTTERPALSMSDVARAKAICADCPVFRTCLTSALGGGSGPREEYGIWAGTSGRTRKRIWELVDSGAIGLAAVIDNICLGDGAQYERSSAPRMVSLKPEVAA